MRFVVCGIALVVALTGCKRLSTQAREDFAKRNSCPEDRVEVKDRPDLSAEAVLAAPKKKPKEKKIPPEVAADPGRLAKWEKDNADKAEARSGVYSGYDVYEVSGCDHQELVACHHPASHRGSTNSLASCQVGGQP